MPWVLLHESGLDYTFYHESAEANVAQLVDSVVSYQRTPGLFQSYGAWSISFDDPEGLNPAYGVRITVNEFVAGLGAISTIYNPAQFQLTFDGTFSDIFNEAPTLDDPSWPGVNVWVNEFIPSPIEDQAGSPLLMLQYAPTSKSEGVPDDESFSFQIEVWQNESPPSDECNFNCECDDPNPSRTLAELRTELMRRAGMSAMTANPPPGMTELLNSFLQSSQRMLYRQYPVLRTERFFTWDMVQGTRFYDLDANRDACTKKLDARMLSWVGISDGCDEWRPLVCGIPPECYQAADQQGVPYRYEIRQCIEVWPAPDSDAYKLRIKGDFGLEPFEEDEDQCTIDDEAVFLHALARLKAHLGDPDARNYQQDVERYIGNLTAGAHLTRRYVPGECPEPPLPKPIWIPKVY